LRRAGSSFAKAGVDLEALLARAGAVASDSQAPVASRLEAISLLGFGSSAETAATLLPLLNPKEPQTVQLAALSAFDRLSPPNFAQTLMARWPALNPAVRERIVDALLKRSDRTAGLLDAMEAGVIQRRDLSLMQMVSLRQRTDSELQPRAIKLLGAASDAKRQEVVERFRPALELRGDRERGKALFQQRCQSCHRVATEGFTVGPDLAGVRSGGKEKLLMNILDPNREVPPNYFAHTIETQDGESYSGLIANETATSVTVRQALGVETTIARARIRSTQASKVSLMPEGLEDGLKEQDMADLIEFIFTASK
jgi:putative heme-binding domain-containing protein